MCKHAAFDTPEEAIKAMQKEGRKLEGLSMDEINKLIEEQAMEEIDKRLRRIDKKDNMKEF